MVSQALHPRLYWVLPTHLPKLQICSSQSVQMAGSGDQEAAPTPFRSPASPTLCRFK